jgi:hypothetical protein
MDVAGLVPEELALSHFDETNVVALSRSGWSLAQNSDEDRH